MRYKNIVAGILTGVLVISVAGCSAEKEHSVSSALSYQTTGQKVKKWK